VSRARIRALAAYRPSEEKATMLSACSMFVTEAGGLTMIWNDAHGYRQLRVDYGCDPARYKAMFDARIMRRGCSGWVICSMASGRGRSVCPKSAASPRERRFFRLEPPADRRGRLGSYLGETTISIWRPSMRG
jgi:hypothetical protein